MNKYFILQENIHRSINIQLHSSIISSNHAKRTKSPAHTKISHTNNPLHFHKSAKKYQVEAHCALSIWEIKLIINLMLEYWILKQYWKHILLVCSVFGRRNSIIQNMIWQQLYQYCKFIFTEKKKCEGKNTIIIILQQIRNTKG